MKAKILEIGKRLNSEKNIRKDKQKMNRKT